MHRTVSGSFPAFNTSINTLYIKKYIILYLLQVRVLLAPSVSKPLIILQYSKFFITARTQSAGPHSNTTQNIWTFTFWFLKLSRNRFIINMRWKEAKSGRGRRQASKVGIVKKKIWQGSTEKETRCWIIVRRQNEVQVDETIWWQEAEQQCIKIQSFIFFCLKIKMCRRGFVWVTIVSSPVCFLSASQ